ncbi:sensor histidine kinase [Arthrobacter deserti]|uniref:histidine kinase n=1 Tax=Arthrobacter deserti TaxID=1742687 RepID=A0ABX1JQQ6_9MICC|nr:sensor histidine kinase [Arthrobacter deserti]
MGNMTAVKEAAEGTAVSFTELAARRRGPLRRFFRRRPVVMDWLISGVHLLLSASTLLSGHLPALPLMLLVAAVLLLRRRWPVTVLAVLTVLETVLIVLQPTSQSATLSLWFALYAVAASGPLWTALPALAAATLPRAATYALFLPDLLRAELPADQLAHLDGEVPYVGWVLAAFVAAANLIATGVGSMVRRDRLHADEVARWAADHARLASANERTRIARDMHDVVAHSLSVMIALSDGAAVVVRKDPHRAGEVLDQLSTTGRTALADMRRVLGVLREDGGQGAPLEPVQGDGQLAGLVEGFRAAGLPVRMVVTGPELPQDANFRPTVYRIIQESLTNVLRYARGLSRAEVALAREGSRIRLRVTDDGRGAVPARSLGAGQGVTGMRERAARYSGTVESGPGTHGGWIVDATLYWPGEGEDDINSRFGS